MGLGLNDLEGVAWGDRERVERYGLGLITAERDGYFEEVTAISRTILTPFLADRRSVVSKRDREDMPSPQST